jgi:hypothetical protein
MQPLVTVVIPYTKAHEHLAMTAYASVMAQTIPTRAIVVADTMGQGAGWTRNVAGLDTISLSRIIEPFLIFLDADDTLAPTFVEECLCAYQTGKYVYTSWMCGDVLRKPNLCVQRGFEDDYRSHLVTTLYPTEVFRALGGFDETLPGHEDVDFYLRSAQAGYCGVYLDKPLVNYTEHGQRSNLFNARPDKKDIMDRVYLKNGGQRTIMACCGQPGVQQTIVIGEAQPGDVMAETLWAGMRSEVGYSTGRVYRGGNGSQVPVAPEDLAQMDHLFREIKSAVEVPKREQVLKDAGLV